MSVGTLALKSRTKYVSNESGPLINYLLSGVTRELNESRCTERNIRGKSIKAEGNAPRRLVSFPDRLLSVVHSDLPEARREPGAVAVGPGSLDRQLPAPTGGAVLAFPRAVPDPPRPRLPPAPAPGLPRGLRAAGDAAGRRPFPAGGDLRVHGRGRGAGHPEGSRPWGRVARAGGGAVPGGDSVCLPTSGQALPGAAGPLPAPGMGTGLETGLGLGLGLGPGSGTEMGTGKGTEIGMDGDEMGMGVGMRPRMGMGTGTGLGMGTGLETGLGLGPGSGTEMGTGKGPGMGKEIGIGMGMRWGWGRGWEWGRGWGRGWVWGRGWGWGRGWVWGQGWGWGRGRGRGWGQSRG